VVVRHGARRVAGGEAAGGLPDRCGRRGSRWRDCPRCSSSRCGDIATSHWSAHQTGQFREAVTIAGVTLTVVAAALVGWGIARARRVVTGQATPSVDDAVPSTVGA
jgi:hypothetical protein